MERGFRGVGVVVIGLVMFTHSNSSHGDVDAVDLASTGTAIPAWAGPLAKDLEKPETISAEQQATCEARVLEAINHEFGLELQASDIAPVRAPGWDSEERGFIRGGGYNIRIVSELDRVEADAVRSGRYEGHKNGHADSLVGSLHVTGKINGTQTFSETTDAATGRKTYDFAAHIDSAYAYSPFGLIDHYFTDVLGADTRDPCPGSGDW